MAKDVRSFLGRLAELNELLVVRKEVDPLTQMAALLCQSPRPIIFEKVKGHPGWRVCARLASTKRSLEAALELKTGNTIQEIAERMERGQGRCLLVEGGPVKEKVLRGDEVNLLALPVLTHSQKDGGRYIGAGQLICKDPDTGIRNSAILRLQVKDRNHTGILMEPRHTFINYRKYEERNQAMPVAVVIGHHPVYEFVSSWGGPYEVDELELTSAVLGEPVELVRCETCDLEVPAHSEIVLEGEVPPHVREEEGPFGEFQGYYWTGMGKNPVVKVKAITMRGDAIYRHIQVVRTEIGLFKAVALYQHIKNVGGYDPSDIKDVRILPYSGKFMVVVQVTPKIVGQAKDLILAVLSGPERTPKICVAVDEDVDIDDPGDIFWAISTRVDPQRDVFIIPNTSGHPMDPSLTEISAPGTTWERVGSKMGIDATKPPLSQPEARERMERVLPMGWGKYFLEDFLS